MNKLNGNMVRGTDTDSLLAAAYDAADQANVFLERIINLLDEAQAATDRAHRERVVRDAQLAAANLCFQVDMMAGRLADITRRKTLIVENQNAPQRDNARGVAITCKE